MNTIEIKGERVMKLLSKTFVFIIIKTLVREVNDGRKQ